MHATAEATRDAKSGWGDRMPNDLAMRILLNEAIWSCSWSRSRGKNIDAGESRLLKIPAGSLESPTIGQGPELGDTWSYIGNISEDVHFGGWHCCKNPFYLTAWRSWFSLIRLHQDLSGLSLRFRIQRFQHHLNALYILIQSMNHIRPYTEIWIFATLYWL